MTATGMVGAVRDFLPALVVAVVSVVVAVAVAVVAAAALPAAFAVTSLPRVGSAAMVILVARFFK